MLRGNFIPSRLDTVAKSGDPLRTPRMENASGRKGGKRRNISFQQLIMSGCMLQDLRRTGCRGQKSAHAIIKKKPFTASFLLHMIKTAKNRNSCAGRLWL